jgi:hypothetical protein
VVSQSLMTDHAMAGAKAIVEIFRPCLRDEEVKEAFGMVYEALKATLISYEEKADRMCRRVKPSKN